MSKRKIKTRRQKQVRHVEHGTGETRTSDAATVAWTVSVTTVFLCNIAAVAAHFYSQANPQLSGARMLSQLLLFSAAAIGFLSLMLLPAVFRLRRTPPPTGFLAFAVCNGLAPILAVLVQAMQR
jgi:hypothetical protein